MAGAPNVRSSQQQSRLAGGQPSRSAEEIAGLRTASQSVIYAHVFANADREVGGILVGRTPASGGLPLVTGAIPALSADERRATLTFTQDAWAHIHGTLEREFPPDEQIVGWYHSHPGFGIFLSSHDVFIHEHFFASASQVALVIDPRGRREGVFAWRDSELLPLFERATPGEWTAEAPPRDAALLSATEPTRGSSHSSVRTRQPLLREPQPGGYPLLALVVAAALGLLIGFGIWTLLEGDGGTRSPRPTRSTMRAGHVTTPSRATERPSGYIGG